MSDKKNTPEVKFESTAMPDLTQEEIILIQKKEQKLKLDKASYRPSKSRGEMYKDLLKEEKNLDKDVYEFSPLPDRGISFIIDIVFAIALLKIVFIIAPIEFKIIQLFLDKYHLQFIFGDVLAFKILKWLSVFFAFFFFVVIPVAFFNCSLGKKIIGLRVRGEEVYSISITQAFQREFILKPLSAACLIGFILPFFDKKKKSLHDKILGTFVIKE